MEKDPNKAAPQVIKQFDDLRTKYKIMQASIIEKKRRLKVQIPDIKNSLDAIKMLELAKVRILKVFEFSNFERFACHESADI